MYNYVSHFLTLGLLGKDTRRMKSEEEREKVSATCPVHATKTSLEEMVMQVFLCSNSLIVATHSFLRALLNSRDKQSKTALLLSHMQCDR